MKLTDYITEFLASKGVNCAFGMSGGAAVHLFDSIDKHPQMSMISMTHEQCAAIAADGYARATGNIGVAVTTSGPGATNLLTGVCCSYYDSIPTLMLTGQVATHRLKGERNVRQVGFQETDVISIFQPVTKYAIQVSDPNSIRYHLEKAFSIAFEGRPGPVLIDIPDDLQRAEIDVDAMMKYEPVEEKINEKIIEQVDILNKDISQAKRPVLILGGGLKTPYSDLYKQLVEKLNIPVLLTWAGADLLDNNDPLRIGTFGVYGSRLGNFAVQNADLVITLGTRLSQNLTGGILASFAREAKIVMVDIDANEVSKFKGYGISIAYGINLSLIEFCKIALSKNLEVNNNALQAWKQKITEWKQALPSDFVPAVHDKDPGFLDAYHFLGHLSQHTRNNELLYVDTGGNLTWTCNSLKIRLGQKLFSAWNNTPMGYSLPAAIGAAFSKSNENITCVIGDGGLMICLAELATVSKNRLPIKIFLFNNHGHGIQKQTLQTWLNGKYVGVDESSGLAFPKNYALLVESFGIKYHKLDPAADIDDVLRTVYQDNAPCFIDIEINPDQKLYPVLKFGFPLENQMPFLEEGLVDSQMVVAKFEKTAPSAISDKQSKEGW
jgi:acetolactate synthase-1/2/3 large subunit